MGDTWWAKVKTLFWINRLWVSEEIYACENTFERLFLGALFGSNAPHFIAGWKSDFKDQDENLRAMVFFLHHAGKTRLKLPSYSYVYRDIVPTK